MATLEQWQSQGTVEMLSGQGYPDWAIVEHTDGSGWQVLRRETVNGADDWGCYDRHPSHADAVGFVQETLDFEARATRRQVNRAKYGR